MFKEFKAFAMRGNVLDLAVGIIIGGAFGTIDDDTHRQVQHVSSSVERSEPS